MVQCDFVEVKRWKYSIGMKYQPSARCVPERERFGWNAALVVTVGGFSDFEKWSREELALKVSLKNTVTICFDTSTDANNTLTVCVAESTHRFCNNIPCPDMTVEALKNRPINFGYLDSTSFS